MKFFKGTAAEIAASVKTGSAGDLVTESDTGNIAVADGSTLLGALKRLVRFDEVPILSGGKVPVATLPAATTSAVGALELATNTEVTTGTDTVRAVTPAGVKAAIDARTASTAAQGIVELATTAEATTGTDTARAVTPAGVKAVADPISAVSSRAARKVSIPATSRAAPSFQTGDSLSDDALFASPGSPGGTAVIRHLTIVTGGSVRLLFTNFYPEAPGGATETDGPNDITVRAALEPTLSGTRIPARLNGQRSMVIPGGGAVLTDRMGVSTKRGNSLWSWTHVQVGVGEKFPRGSYATGGSANEGHNYTAAGGAAGADVTVTGARPTTINEYVYCPAAILVEPVDAGRAVVAVVGDSISAGTGDNQNGWVERSLEARWSFIKLGYPSEAMAAWVTDNPATCHRRAAVMAAVGATDILALHGRNDMDLTLATIKSNAVAYWTYLSRFARTWGSTITPYTDSTDAYATVGNQSLHGTSNPNRLNYNAWLRDGAPIDSTSKAPVAIGTVANTSRCAVYSSTGAVVSAASGAAVHPLSGVLEVADLGESSRDSGFWKAGYTTDGIHPNATGAAGMQAAGGNTMLAAVLGASAT